MAGNINNQNLVIAEERLLQRTPVRGDYARESLEMSPFIHTIQDKYISNHIVNTNRYDYINKVLESFHNNITRSNITTQEFQASDDYFQEALLDVINVTLNYGNSENITPLLTNLLRSTYVESLQRYNKDSRDLVEPTNVKNMISSRDIVVSLANLRGLELYEGLLAEARKDTPLIVDAIAELKGISPEMADAVLRLVATSELGHVALGMLYKYVGFARSAEGISAENVVTTRDGYSFNTAPSGAPTSRGTSYVPTVEEIIGFANDIIVQMKDVLGFTLSADMERKITAGIDGGTLAIIHDIVIAQRIPDMNLDIMTIYLDACNTVYNFELPALLYSPEYFYALLGLTMCVIKTSPAGTQFNQIASDVIVEVGYYEPETNMELSYIPIDTAMDLEKAIDFDITFGTRTTALNYCKINRRIEEERYLRDLFYGNSALINPEAIINHARSLDSRFTSLRPKDITVYLQYHKINMSKYESRAQTDINSYLASSINRWFLS